MNLGPGLYLHNVSLLPSQFQVSPLIDRPNDPFGLKAKSQKWKIASEVEMRPSDSVGEVQEKDYGFRFPNNVFQCHFIMIFLEQIVTHIRKWFLRKQYLKWKVLLNWNILRKRSIFCVNQNWRPPTQNANLKSVEMETLASSSRPFLTPPDTAICCWFLWLNPFTVSFVCICALVCGWLTAASGNLYFGQLIVFMC